MAETLRDKIGSHRHSLSNQLNDEKAGSRRDYEVERERGIDLFNIYVLRNLKGKGTTN